MAFNIFSTLNQNLQNFWGDAYDAYQAWKSKVGNVASTINTNLQDFWGDVYDVGSTIKKNVSNFWTQTYNQWKNVASTIQKNVWDYYEKWLKPIPWQAYDATIGRASKGFTDYAKGVIDYGREREASNVWIEDSKALKVMQAMKDEWYSKDEILAQMSQFDMQEKARKQQAYTQKQTSARENASTGRKLLSGAVDFVWGAEAGMMRLPAGVTDFVSGGTDYTKDTMQGINDFTSRSGMARAGDIAGQIAGTALIPGVGRIAPSGTSLAATAGRGAVYGGAFGGLTPIMEKGSDATASDIGYGALGGAAMGAVAGPLLEKVVAPAIGKVAQSTTSWLKAAKFTQGSISDKIGAGLQASGKNISRWIKSIPMWGETLTRNIPKAIVKRDLWFDRTQRTKIENILGGMDEAQYVLKKWLAGKPKEELAEIFMKQSDDAYNGITTKLSNINKTVKSTSADEALQDILDQLNSSPKIQRAYAKDIVWVENMLKKWEYTLSDLNNIRRAYDKVNTGMFTVQGKARSGLENDIDVKVRKWLSDQLQKEAKIYGVDVKEMNKELRAGLAMKDALLVKLSQEWKNNFLWLQDIWVSAILSGGNPVSAVAMIAAKKYSEKVAPWIAQKLYNTNKNPNVTRLVSRGNTITPRNKSSGLGLASSTSTPMVSDAVKPPIVSKAKPKATTESSLKTTPIVPEKKSIVAKKEVKTDTSSVPMPKQLMDIIKTSKNQDDMVSKLREASNNSYEFRDAITAYEKSGWKDMTYAELFGMKKSLTKPTTESAFKNNKGFINPSEIKKSLVPKKWADEARQFYDDLVYAGNSPIVAQRETAKRFGTIRAMSASKAGTFWGEWAKEAPKTWWFKWADGKMKFEIDDSKANFEFPKRTSNESRIQNAKANFETAKLDDVQIKDAMEIDWFKWTPKEYRDELIKHGYEDMYNIKSGNYRLWDILQHSDLYKQYPWLENTPVSFHTEWWMRSAWEMTNWKISIALNAKDPKSVILHEIQHIIQEKEWFARGGNPESFKQWIEYYKKLADYNRDILWDIRYDKMLEKDKTSIAYKKLVKEEEEALRTYKIANEKYKELSSISPMESYNNQAWEVEARNVQTRMNMTAKERALKSPESTEDVPRNKQIVRLKNDGTSMSIDKAGTMEIPEALVQEARKYKSADEFIKSKWKPVYHGTNSDFSEFSLRYSWQTDPWFLWTWIYLTPSKSIAKVYWKKIMNVYPDIKNPLVIDDVYMFWWVNPDKIRSILWISKNSKPSEVRAKLIEKWYDWVYVNEILGWWKKKLVEVVALNPSKVKTEAQLKQIYDQANKK